jgi:hypothetical protein
LRERTEICSLLPTRLGIGEKAIRRLIVPWRAQVRECRNSDIKNNVFANSMLVQAQSDLSDVQERKQTALAAVALAKQRLASAELDLAR